MKTMIIFAAGVLALAACDRDRPGQTTTTGGRVDWTERAEDKTERAGDKAENKAERAEEKAEHAGDKIENKAEHAGDKIENKAEHAGDKTENKAESAGNKIEGAAKDVKQEAKEQYNKVDRKLSDETAEQRRAREARERKAEQH